MHGLAAAVALTISSLALVVVYFFIGRLIWRHRIRRVAPPDKRRDASVE